LVKKILQIATLGKDTDTVLVGLRNFPAHKLVLICLSEDKAIADDFSSSLKRVLKIPIEVYCLEGRDILSGLLTAISNILEKDSKNFDDVIMNVAGGDKLLTCGALSAAFVNGTKAFHVMGDTPILLPVLKMSYSEVVSTAKMEILRAIDKAGGLVESLQELSKLANYGKPLLSYHIQGAQDSRGLMELGLVDVERGRRGKSRVKLTTLGRMLLLGKPGVST